jgi:hypothetical protein
MVAVVSTVTTVVMGRGNKEVSMKCPNEGCPNSIDPEGVYMECPRCFYLAKPAKKEHIPGVDCPCGGEIADVPYARGYCLRCGREDWGASPSDEEMPF